MWARSAGQFGLLAGKGSHVGVKVAVPAAGCLLIDWRVEQFAQKQFTQRADVGHIESTRHDVGNAAIEQHCLFQFTVGLASFLLAEHIHATDDLAVQGTDGERRVKPAEHFQPLFAFKPPVILGFGISCRLRHWRFAQLGEPQDGDLHHDRMVMKNASQRMPYFLFRAAENRSASQRPQARQRQNQLAADLSPALPTGP